MSETATAARPYARAVFELANEGGRIDQWSERLELLAALVKLDELRSLITQPGIDAGKLAEIVSEAGKADSDAERNFVRLLARNRRLLLLPVIAQAYAALCREQEQVLDVTVATAVAVTDEQREVLAKAVARHLGSKTDIHWEVDESLVAGARIRAGDQLVDASAAGALAQLRDCVIA